MRSERPKRKHVKTLEPGVEAFTEWTLWDYLGEILLRVEAIEEKLRREVKTT